MLAFAVLILGGGAWLYERETARSRAGKLREIESIATLKVDQVAYWRQERLMDALAGARSQHFIEAVREAEARSPDGSMSTVGDVGYVDKDNFLYLTDRATFMIISGGVNIYPQECENLLITHPKIADAAVFGVPNPDLGEEVKAVVQPMPGVSPGQELADELIAFCSQSLSRQKVPRSIDFEAELPRLPTGKLYKRLLRDRYWGNTTSRIV